jgi:DNA-binding NarL/FixJ family response regulator
MPKLALLIVDDDPRTIHSLRHYLPKTMVTTIVGAAIDAVDRINSQDQFHGLIVDVGLPDFSGTIVLDYWRRQRPGVPAVVITGRGTEGANHAMLRGAQFLSKPFGKDELDVFLDWVRRAHWKLPPELEGPFLALIEEHRVPDKRAVVLARYLTHTPRRQIAEELGISVNTVRTHVRRLLQTVEASSMDSLRDRLLRASTASAAERERERERPSDRLTRTRLARSSGARGRPAPVWPGGVAAENVSLARRAPADPRLWDRGYGRLARLSPSPLPPFRSSALPT